MTDYCIHFFALLYFTGEESAEASFSRSDETVRTIDKDGFVPALLSAEITAKLSLVIRGLYIMNSQKKSAEANPVQKETI